jgi:MFS family permease
MRRLLLLVSAIVAADTTFFTALTPLLPHFAHEYGLSKAAAGIFTATYATGVLLGAIPAGLAARRLGAKRAVLTGLALMTTASFGFAIAGSIWTLGLARALQGFGSAFSWAGGLAWLMSTAPRERRGELLGTAMGAAVFGALLGPVLAAVTALIGTRPTFLLLSGGGVALIGWAATTAGVPLEDQPRRHLVAALRERQLFAGLWFIVLPSLLFGVLIVLVPLKLNAHGWGTVAIGAVFLATTALETVLNPLLGRFTDRRGRLQPIRGALLGSLVVSVALAWATRPELLVPLVLLAGITYGAFYTPGLALISDGAERAGLAQGVAFAVMNAVWGIGAMVGPAAGGALASIAGDSSPYLVLAAICLATYAASRAQPGKAAPSAFP